MDILAFNHHWFADEWRKLGHRVIVCGLEPCGPDLVYPGAIPHIDRVLEALPEDFNPGAIIYYDNSYPLLLTGISDTEIPTLFYSVDVHHHLNFHKYLGHMFDVTLVAQSDYIRDFENHGVNACWMPLWAPKIVEPIAEKEFGAVFVGNLNPDLNPDRTRFFKELEEVAPIHVCSADYTTIFPKASIVVNQTVKGDLNFRVFEGMACGALMLTEKSDNGLHEIFEEGKHLVTYEKGNIKDAAEKIRYFTDHPEEAQRIAEAGRKLVLEKHRNENRAEFVLEQALNSSKRRSGIVHFANMFAMSIISNSKKPIGTNSRLRAMTLAVESARAALLNREPLTEEISHCLVASAIMFDSLFNVDLAGQLLNDFRLAYPQESLFQVATIRQVLNSGDRAEAERLANEMATEFPPEEIFRRSEYVINAIMSETGLGSSNLFNDQ